MSINAQVDPTKDESEFRGEITQTLRNFIDGDWKIQSIQRSKGTGKYETVWVQATARVPERENYQLTDRANVVSRIGFELVGPNVDYSLNFDEIQQVNRELRLSLIQQALDECRSINESYQKAGYLRRNTEYRVSSTRFDIGNNQNFTPGARAYAANMTASMAPMSPMGGSPKHVQMYETQTDELGSDTDEPMDVNVSTRFSMTGHVILRAVVH